MKEDIADIVLVQGREYVGRTTILGKEYITVYKPIMGSAGTPVGAMFAGQNLTIYQQERNNMLFFVYAVAIVAVAISIGIAISIGRKISEPVIRSVRMLGESEEQFSPNV